MGPGNPVLVMTSIRRSKISTKCESFLAAMGAVVSWNALADLIKPHYLKASSKVRRPLHPLETILRIHCYSSGTV